ncbi:tetratricopeptide (TPR) repeat protein [Streptomyces aurantiacus]|nr:tetratricopeptide (TPR) repeat protein [Streptomyces aurantiacus]
MSPRSNDDAQERDLADAAAEPVEAVDAVEAAPAPEATEAPAASGAAEASAVPEPLRSPEPAGRRPRVLHLAACAVALAVAMSAGAVVLGSRDDGGTSTVSSAPGLAPELLAGGSLASSISALQSHLKAQPKDSGGWSTLGIAYVEQARTTGDPSRYPQAQRALERSLELSPGNDPALAGRAALAAARHEFPEALTYAEKALDENAFNERALSVRIDALVELGRYEQASKAADEADSRRPGVPVFTRYAYVHELRGDVRTARRVLEQALAGATAPGGRRVRGVVAGPALLARGRVRAGAEVLRAGAAGRRDLPAGAGGAGPRAGGGR